MERFDVTEMHYIPDKCSSWPCKQDRTTSCVLISQIPVIHWGRTINRPK